MKIVPKPGKTLAWSLAVAMVLLLLPLGMTLDSHAQWEDEEEELQGWGIVLKGIDGGGNVSTGNRDVHFSIFATHVFPESDDSGPTVIGQVHWTETDADGSVMTLESVSVDEYGWIDDVEGGRWLRGTMSVDGEGDFPFFLRAVDAGAPGSGADTVELMVGSAIEGHEDASFGYQLAGELNAGDLQILDFEFEVSDDIATPQGSS